MTIALKGQVNMKFISYEMVGSLAVETAIIFNRRHRTTASNNTTNHTRGVATGLN